MGVCFTFTFLLDIALAFGSQHWTTHFRMDFTPTLTRCLEIAMGWESGGNTIWMDGYRTALSTSRLNNSFFSHLDRDENLISLRGDLLVYDNDTWVHREASCLKFLGGVLWGRSGGVGGRYFYLERVWNELSFYVFISKFIVSSSVFRSRFLVPVGLMDCASVKWVVRRLLFILIIDLCLCLRLTYACPSSIDLLWL